jgi:hypothetical protein
MDSPHDMYSHLERTYSFTILSKATNTMNHQEILTALVRDFPNRAKSKHDLIQGPGNPRRKEFIKR